MISWHFIGWVELMRSVPVLWFCDFIFAIFIVVFPPNFYLIAAEKFKVDSRSDTSTICCPIAHGMRVRHFLDIKPISISIMLVRYCVAFSDTKVNQKFNQADH
uniref:Uncharacterized protein n=1 Tax=Glossina palpalis gambiensis TaxID=67801 RepID=A0A1B0BSZ1_9MUSC